MQVVLEAKELDLPHDDPADRFLAATAMIYELTLAPVEDYSAPIAGDTSQFS